MACATPTSCSAPTFSARGAAHNSAEQSPRPDISGLFHFSLFSIMLYMSYYLNAKILNEVMRHMDTSEYLSMGDVARLLGVTKARISQLAASGTLACNMVGGRKMVEYNSAIAYQKVRKRGRRPAADVGRKFTLMSADYEVAHVSFDPTREFSFEIAEVLDPQRMPFGTCSSASPTVNKRELNAWWGHRSVPDVRPGLISRYRELGIVNGIEVPVGCLGLSLSDCYWLRPDRLRGTRMATSQLLRK